MKFTIMGFRQEKLVELGLDTMDATILRYFIDFKDSNGMKVKIIDGQEYLLTKLLEKVVPILILA